jgi:hypothetical protein
MGYGTYTYQKFPIDYLVGVYGSNALSPSAPPVGGSIVVTGTVPPGLTANVGSNTLSGYATTEGDYNIVVTVKNSGNITVYTYKYTVVVLTVDITVGSSLTTTAYTSLSQIFSYSVSGSYTPTDTGTLVWIDAGSSLPLGVTLNTGTGASASLSGSSLEAGEFLVYLQVTDLDGHTYSKRFNLELTTATSIDSSFKPSLKTVAKVGATVASVFTMPYGNVGGYAPSNYLHYTWTTYPSPIPAIPSGSNAALDILTGIFTYTPSVYYDHNYRTVINDAPIQKKITKITNRIVRHITGSLSFDGVDITTPTTWLTTKNTPSSQVNELYSYNLNDDTVTSAPGNPYTYAINAIKGPDFEATLKPTSLYMVTGPETSNTEFVLREISTVDLTQTLSKTFNVASSGMSFNDIVRGSTVGKVLLLGNSQGCYLYTMGTETLVISSVLNVDRYYECGVSTINSGIEYFWILNKTDKQLIKYNPSLNTVVATYNLPSANLSNSSAKNGIGQANNQYIYITDSGNSKVYIFNIAGASFSTSTFSGSYVTPTSCFYDGNYVYILFQDTNNIYVGAPSNLAAHYTINLHTDRRLIEITYSGGGAKTYDAAGPLRTGSVLIRQFTKDYGLVTLADNGSGTLISSNTTAIPSTGTISYTSGQVSFTEYNQGESFPIDISYVTLPTNMIGGRRRDTHGVDWVVNNPFIISGYSFYSYVDHTVKMSIGLSFNKTSTDTINPVWIKDVAVKESVQISGGTPSYVPSLLDGTMPASVTIEYPDIDNTYFAIAGPATAAGTYYFTVEVDDSVNTEYVYVLSDIHPGHGGT